MTSGTCSNVCGVVLCIAILIAACVWFGRGEICLDRGQAAPNSTVIIKVSRHCVLRDETYRDAHRHGIEGHRKGRRADVDCC